MLALALVLIVAALVALLAALGLLDHEPADEDTQTEASTSLFVSSQGVSRSSVAWLGTLITPRPFAERIRRDLTLAGRPRSWSVGRVVSAKVLTTVLGLVLAALVIGVVPGAAGVVMAVLAVVLAYAAPDIVLHGRAHERQMRIERELPDTLDQVTISIEAGLGFEAALSRSALQGTGPLAEELVRTVQDMRVGMSRRDAYLALIERTSVDDLRRFAKSIIQAEEYGIPVSGVVRTQAKEMRTKRRLRASTRAQQVPVKLLFPLMVCIFPVLFIIVLAPAFFNAASFFQGN